LRRSGRCRERHSDVHGGRRREHAYGSRTPTQLHGVSVGVLRTGRFGAGRQDMQQHDTRHDHGGGGRGNEPGH